MSTNEIIIFFLLLGACIIYVLNESKKKKNKSSYLKKEELIHSYESSVMDFNAKNYSKEEKIEFMKKLHKKLHNNIFFTDDEVKRLMLKLSSL